MAQSALLTLDGKPIVHGFWQRAAAFVTSPPRLASVACCVLFGAVEGLITGDALVATGSIIGNLCTAGMFDVLWNVFPRNHRKREVIEKEWAIYSGVVDDVYSDKEGLHSTPFVEPSPSSKTVNNGAMETDFAAARCAKEKKGLIHLLWLYGVAGAALCVVCPTPNHTLHHIFIIIPSVSSVLFSSLNTLLFWNNIANNRSRLIEVIQGPPTLPPSVRGSSGFSETALTGQPLPCPLLKSRLT